jgi:type II secretory pathway pseudopilin PulG
MLMRMRYYAGFTLAELLVAAVMLGVIGTAVLSVILAESRAHAAAAQRMDARRTVRTGAEVLRADLRAIATPAPGIYAIEADAIEFRSVMGSSVICHVDAARTRVGIPPTMAEEGALTSWVVAPQRGDTVLVYSEKPGSEQEENGSAPEPGGWHTHVLAEDPSGGGTCPTSTGFARSAAEAARALTLRLTPPLGEAVEPGAALRFVRRARYQLYRAGDGHWYLGHLDCLSSRATPCTTVQPVAGPFPHDGVRFTYRDSTGGITNDPTRVARIDLLTRALGRHMPTGGSAPAHLADSTLITITLRNR